MCNCRNVELKFSKVKKDAVIPSKNDWDMGFDLYANFEEESLFIHPQEVKLIGTGIATAFTTEYGALVRERGSSGTKCMSVRAGVIEGSYRGEWFVPINNTGNKSIVITKNPDKFDESEYIIYPYTKGIAQFVLIPVPKVKCQEITYDDLLSITSNRGVGKLGSSDK